MIKRISNLFFLTGLFLGIQILLLILIASPCLHAANNFSFSSNIRSLEAIKPPLKTLRLGEHLTYDVFWMGVPVGKGELWVKEKVKLNGREAFHVVAVAETNRFLSKIYPVRDEVHSWIDAETFQSLQFQKKSIGRPLPCRGARLL